MNNFLPPAFLLSVFFFVGVAWAQGGYIDFKAQEKRPSPTTSVSGDYQSLNSSKGLDGHNVKAPTQKAPAVKKSSKIPMAVCPDSGARKASIRSPGAAKGQSIRSQENAVGSGLSVKGNSQSVNSGSTSFLDGYLLKSLHSSDMPRKKAINVTPSKEELQKKAKDSAH